MENVYYILLPFTIEMKIQNVKFVYSAIAISQYCMLLQYKLFVRTLDNDIKYVETAIALYTNILKLKMVIKQRNFFSFLDVTRKQEKNISVTKYHHVYIVIFAYAMSVQI